MTSSLVGSEMCIRDRAPAMASRPSPWSLGSWGRWCRLPLALGGPSPVSYTHLTLPTICSV
eukprot:10702172-Prorocentrum_lima.AAC.1